MDVEFLLGPAGTGKTHRCLAALRAELAEHPEGPPLIFLAPKQATFQLERQLLEDGSLAGFTRLHILSFPRLAHFLHERLGLPEPRLLDETGRVMVLRALLREHRDSLVVYRRSAAQPGFAGELSRQMREFQEQGVTPSDLDDAAEQVGVPATLAGKLHDTARLIRAYAGWLQSRGLTDADALLDTAADGLASARARGQRPTIGGVWLDGFAEMTPQEIRLLTEVVATAGRSALAFCLDQLPSAEPAPLSLWSGIGDTFRRVHARLAQSPGARIGISHLARDATRSRFSRAPFLAHLETHWRAPRTAEGAPENLSLQAADSVEAEALLAAREIRRHVAQGGRYRECAVLLRSLDTHGDVFRRVWRRLGLPLFLDRREPVGREPLTTLTRCAMRLGPGNWAHEDWFGALRSGLAGVDLGTVDRWENAALARGWEGRYWAGTGTETRLPADQETVVAPFRHFTRAIVDTPSGLEMVTALTRLWEQLEVEATLSQWDGDHGGAGLGHHQSVHRQMQAWLEEIQRALGDTRMSANEWLEVFESAWSTLTVGQVPPALDQVLVGAIDRSRNPHLELVVLPGWNDGVFPQTGGTAGLLTAAERRWLRSASSPRPVHLPEVVTAARESFFAYISLTRAARRVVVTWVSAPAPAAPRSAYVTRLEQLGAPREPGANPDRAVDLWRQLSPIPVPAPEPAAGTEHLTPGIAAALLGRHLSLSASRLERLATCPHRAFLQDLLRVREREVLQFEALEQGDLLHQVLAEYHRNVQAEKGSWAETDPSVVTRRFQAAAQEVLQRDAHFANPRRSFAEQHLIARLQRFVQHSARWMRAYGFQPESAELAFGTRPPTQLPPLQMTLNSGQTVAVEGKIDRVDRSVDGSGAVVVIDYKSRERKWNQRAVDAGLELQLALYALVLEAAQWPVAGMAYASLNDRPAGAKSRADSAATQGKDATFAHRGRFSEARIVRGGESAVPLPFKWTRKKDGQPMKQGDLRSAEEFQRLLTQTADHVKALAERLFRGEIAAVPNPAAKDFPCERCDVRDACRI